MLTRLTPTTSVGYLLAAYFVFGVGAGLANPPITNTALSGMPPSQAGVAAAIASTSRQVGMTPGVAVIASRRVPHRPATASASSRRGSPRVIRVD
jgi:hypothetical protein